MSEVVFQSMSRRQAYHPTVVLTFLKASPCEGLRDVMGACQIAQKFCINASSDHVPSQGISRCLNPRRPELFFAHDGVRPKQDPMGRRPFFEEALNVVLGRAFSELNTPEREGCCTHWAAHHPFGFQSCSRRSPSRGASSSRCFTLEIPDFFKTLSIST